MVNLLQDFAFELDTAALADELHILPGSADGTKFAGMVAAAQEVARPKVLMTESYISERGEDTVQVDDVVFTSRALRANLDDINRVFPFVATCGMEIEEVSASGGDFIVDYWWRTIKLALLEVAIAHLYDTVRARYGLGGLSMSNPGSGEASVWPIEQQAVLFSLLGDVQAQIGVQLMPSYLMVPEMTTSGILFPSEKTYRNCQLCQREDCPGRSAHFDPALWAEVMG